MAVGRERKKTNGKSLTGQASVNSAIKSICDIMRRSNCAGALQYVPELTWILFLRILDEREAHEAEEAEALGLSFTPSLAEPYRWRDWAAPVDGTLRVPNSAHGVCGLRSLRADKKASLFDFVHGQLLPHLKAMKDKPGATGRQKVISEIMSSVERSRVDSEKNFADVLDKVHEITSQAVDDTHVFTLSQVYEGLLLKMGEKGNDGGQFFTPREVIRVMVRVVDPQIGRTVYDPGCGTCGFLAQAFEYMRAKAGDAITPVELETLRSRTFYGREKDNAVYPIALANLVLHGIDEPHIWHGNALSGIATYDGLFAGAPQFFDYVLTAIPVGGKEGKEAQTPYDYKTQSTSMLFLQYVMSRMKSGATCGFVLDEGALFRTSESAFVQIKRKLLEEFNVWCIVSLPVGTYSSHTKDNILFFTKGEPTESIWYFDLSDVKVGKKTPFTQAHFDEFFRRLPLLRSPHTPCADDGTRSVPATLESERSWTVPFSARLQQALEEARPYRERAAQLFSQAKLLEDDLKEKRKQKKATEETLAALENKWKSVLREARENESKAQTIEDAVYDLKAVNPNKTDDSDKRTPTQLLEVIEAKGHEADAALARLQALICSAERDRPLI